MTSPPSPASALMIFLAIGLSFFLLFSGTVTQQPNTSQHAVISVSPFISSAPRSPCPPPNLPNLTIPNPFTNIGGFLNGSWILSNVENVFFWILDWALYGISVSVDSLFLAIEGLVISIIQLVFDITYFLGPLSAPLFLVLCMGMLGFIGLIFDQIMSWIPK